MGLSLAEGPLSIGKLDLIDGGVASSAEAAGADAVLGLEEEDLWSPGEDLLPDEPGTAAWMGEASDGQTLDLDVEWQPETPSEVASGMTPPEPALEIDSEIEIELAGPTRARGDQSDSLIGSSIPARAEDAFLDLLED